MGSIRFLLAITVVLCHSPWLDGLFFIGGRNAVQIFYVISGFLISYLLLEKKSYVNVQSFYLSRWLRIWPLYALVALFSLLLNRHFTDFYRHLPFDAAILLVVSNIIIFGQDMVMFMGIDQANLVFTKDFKNSEILLFQGLIISPAWSLAVELMFYLVAPFILHRRALMLTVLLASLALRVVLINLGFGNIDPWSYRFFPTELAIFLLGAVSHQILMPFYKQCFGKKLTSISAYVTASFVTFALVFNLLFQNVNQDLSNAIAILLFVIIVPFTFIFTVQNNWDTLIGELSYPIYIGHAVILFVVGKYFPRMGITDVFYLAMANVLFSITFAIFLNRIANKYFEPMRKKVRSSKLVNNLSIR